MVLNPDPSDAPPEDNVAVVLRKLSMVLKGTLTCDTVDYIALETSSVWKEFLDTLAFLHHVKANDLPDDAAKVAFFLNMYNVLMIHGLIDKKCQQHPIQEGNAGFFDEIAYNIGGLVFSLNAMEHGVLRCNRPHPGKNAGPFPRGDPRLMWCVSHMDPRIHFALNCGAKGCPRIQAYNLENLEKGLRMAVAAFLEGIPEPDDAVLRVSMLFKWYGCDFGASEEEIARWICSHATHLQDKQVSRLEFEPYDWNLNNR